MKTSFQKLVWLGALASSTVTFAVASVNSQVVIGNPETQTPYKLWPPAFDGVGDIVDRWIENGREFMNRNGQTCEYLRRALVGEFLISDLRFACIGYHNPS